MIKGIFPNHSEIVNMVVAAERLIQKVRVLEICSLKHHYLIYNLKQISSVSCWCWALKVQCLDILFSSNRNIHKSSYGLCFWASDPLINRFYCCLSIKVSEDQKQRPRQLLWMLWFDGKNISRMHIIYHFE